MRAWWRIERVVNFQKDKKTWGNGYALFGFHDSAGRQHVVDYWNNWVGCLGPTGRLCWSAGATPQPESDLHVPVDLRGPGYVAVTPTGKTLVACFHGNAVHAIDLARQEASIFIDGGVLGLKDIGNCVHDLEGNIWVNEVVGGRIWQFSPEGSPLQTVGTGTPGFQVESVPFEQAEFTWIFDLRLGPDGNLYVTDIHNFAVRKLDLKHRTVSTIAGTGQGGYSGDGGDARLATLGHNPTERYGGPWALSLDEAGNVYIGDTQNHVVRIVERATNVIRTIAGRLKVTPDLRNSPAETNPLDLNLPRICGMEYWNGRLFVTEWDGDLAVLAKI